MVTDALFQSSLFIPTYPVSIPVHELQLAFPVNFLVETGLKMDLEINDLQREIQRVLSHSRMQKRAIYLYLYQRVLAKLFHPMFTVRLLAEEFTQVLAPTFGCQRMVLSEQGEQMEEEFRMTTR